MRARLILLAALALAVTGCTGPGILERQSWLFGKDPPDDPALLARLGPTPTQRVALVRSMRDQMEDSPQEADRLARELAQRIATEEDEGVRIEIVRALAASRSPVATAVLRAGLNYPQIDPDKAVRAEICRAWGQIGGAEARTVLAATMASDTDEDVRIAAARALGEFEDAGNVAALAAALSDEINVQLAAMESMEKLTGRDYGDNAEKWREYAKSGTVQDDTPSLANRLWPFH